MENLVIVLSCAHIVTSSGHSVYYRLSGHIVKKITYRKTKQNKTLLCCAFHTVLKLIYPISNNSNAFCSVFHQGVKPVPGKTAPTHLQYVHAEICCLCSWISTAESSELTLSLLYKGVQKTSGIGTWRQSYRGNCCRAAGLS